MFCRYVLMTTDDTRARRFYTQTIGLEIPVGDSDGASVLGTRILHERARAAGAPAHWLGHIATRDVDAAASRFVELGGEQLGPMSRTADGAAFITLRDPHGAVVAVCEPQPSPTRSLVAWHQLHSRDADQSWADYSALFDWKEAGKVDADPPGGHRLFTWDLGVGPMGSIANTARWPGVHTHWLFYWAVEDIDAAIARVRKLGGKAHDPIDFPAVGRVSACDDPEGAAFGLVTTG